MNDIAIRAAKLSKQYKIGVAKQRHDTLRDHLMESVKALFAGNGNNSTDSHLNDTIWSLRDVSFEVKKGEVLGIIGRNGAGKSTLLKILSRITEPTSGEAEIYGRVGSLLEVGTGFHNELSGRENVYLNGAILGMKKVEIDRKFDEIVAFAEVEKFIDTPVKRYSSGMYMRLAFAVAAHLEPDILIVDEVLAVGDAEFQKKCLGKMGDVAKAGRTVLFVSHNMQAVVRLTDRCLLLVNGQCRFDGPTPHALSTYNALMNINGTSGGYYEAPQEILHNHLAWARVHTSDPYGQHRWGEPIVLEFALRVTEPLESLFFSFQVVNDLQQPICHFWPVDSQMPYRKNRGTFLLRCEVPKFRLYMGRYTLTTWLSERRGDNIFQSLTDICPFEVTMQGIDREDYAWEPGTCTYLEEARWALVEQEALRKT